MKEIPYLKEKELEELIRKIEEEELKAAPPDLLDNLLSAIEETGQKPSISAIEETGKKPAISAVEETEQKPSISAVEETGQKPSISAVKTEERKQIISIIETRRREYRRFCRRVISTAAAAVVLILVMSGRLYLQGTAVPSKTAVMLKERPVVSKESVAKQDQRGVLSILRNSEKLSDIIFRRDKEDET